MDQDTASSAPKGSGMMTGLLWVVAIFALIIGIVAIILVFALKPKPSPVAPLPIVTENVSSAQSGTVTIAGPKTNVYRFTGVIPTSSNVSVAISGASTNASTLFFVLNDASGSTTHADTTKPAPTGGYLKLANATGGFYYLARGEYASCLSSGASSYAVASSTGGGPFTS